MSEALEKSEKIKNRFIELLNSNELFTHNELQIIEALFQKYELISVSEYSKKVNKSYNGILYLIKQGKVASIEISNQTFIFNKL